MGAKGDLLELLDDAPRQVHSLDGWIREWRDPELLHRAFEYLSEQRGSRSSAIGRFGTAGPNDERRHVLIELPNKWRIETDDRVDVSNGETHWFGRSDRIIEDNERVPDIDSTEFARLLTPGPLLLGFMRFGQPQSDVVADRECLRVDARPEVGHRFPGSMMTAMNYGGVDHTFWFDGETGVVLRHIGMFEGRRCTSMEFEEVTINLSIPAERFVFVPPGDATVEHPIDQLLSMAVARGVDLSGIDTSDVAAIRAAVLETLHPGTPSTASMRRQKRDKHIPMGAPPENLAEARDGVEAAYANLRATSEDGSTLVNVQRGQGLAEPLNLAKRRLPGSNDDSIEIVVDDVKFVRPDEAVVWFSIEVGGERNPMVNGREGRAFLIDDRWVVAHATLADLLTAAGVPVPSQDE